MNKEIIENIKIMARYLGLDIYNLPIDCWHAKPLRNYLRLKVGDSVYDKMTNSKDSYSFTLQTVTLEVTWRSWSTSYHNGDAYDKDEVTFKLDSEDMLNSLNSYLYRLAKDKASTKAMEQLKTKITLDELSRVGIKKGW